MSSTPTVAWISIAPVKSMALQALSAADVTMQGIPGDRRFAVLDASTHQLLNAKRLPRLLLVTPEIAPDGGHLALRFPDGTRVAAAVDRLEPATGIFFGRERAVRHLAGPFDAALSVFAGGAVRLVELAHPGAGVDRAELGAGVSIADVAALGELAAAAGRAEPLDPRRFRMTIGVEGVAAYAEDAWLDREVRIGEAVVRPTGNVGRCAVTTRHPDTGETDVDTLGCLAQTRGHIRGTEALPFGVWATVVAAGRVRLGDPITIGEESHR